MKIITTPRELMDKGRWDDACAIFGFNPWACNEGLMSSDYEIELNEEQALKLGYNIRY